MKVLIVLLIAVFAACAFAQEEEADFPWLMAVGLASKFFGRKKKDNIESDWRYRYWDDEEADGAPSAVTICRNRCRGFKDFRCEEKCLEKMRGETDDVEADVVCGVHCYTELNSCKDFSRLKSICGAKDSSRACFDYHMNQCATNLQACKRKAACPQWINDDEEADAEFFKKLSSWFKKNVTPENIQKGMDGYRTIRNSDDAEVEADTESAQLCTTASLNFRASPCTNGALKKTLPQGSRVTKTGGETTACGYTWVQTNEGWAAKNFLTQCSGGSSPGGSSSAGSPAGKRAADFARAQVGKCYSQDVNLRRGPRCFDCSGLVNVAWGNQGVTMPWTTHGYPSASNLRTVSPSDAQPGDVLYRPGHVGMYVGNGEVVEAANTKLGVIKSRFANWRYTAIYRPK